MDYANGLGGTLGSREAFLSAGLELLAGTAGCELVASSHLYESEPVGPPQPHYLNAAARIRSALDPHALLARLLEIERVLGRERRERWGARTLDLDILWAQANVDSPSLQIPHPQLSRRWFALVPMLEVVPELAASMPAPRMAGRKLHLLAPAQHVERSASGVLHAPNALDHADALAATLTAAAREREPVRPCKDIRVELLRVAAPREQQRAALRVALDALDARGFGVCRVLIAAVDDREVTARVLGLPGSSARS
jgi:2-amino-4-hydroxy-6-hydroxymethyldihydropteridine diphosphokinase